MTPCRDGRGRGAAFADAEIDRHFRTLLPVVAEGGEPHRHVAPALSPVGVSPFHCPAVQPDQSQPRVGHLEQRREAMLGLRAVVMWSDRR